MEDDIEEEEEDRKEEEEWKGFPLKSHSRLGHNKRWGKITTHITTRDIILKIIM